MLSELCEIRSILLNIVKNARLKRVHFDQSQIEHKYLEDIKGMDKSGIAGVSSLPLKCLYREDEGVLNTCNSIDRAIKTHKFGQYGLNSTGDLHYSVVSAATCTTQDLLKINGHAEVVRKPAAIIAMARHSERRKGLYK